jgi:hypothetical protein
MPASSLQKEICSGHGRCVSMARAAVIESAMPLSPPTSYEDANGFGVAGATAGGAQWDENMIYGCVCDSSWTVGAVPWHLVRSAWCFLCSTCTLHCTALHMRCVLSMVL